MMGYDALFFHGGDDSLMVARAVAEDRVILTRDTAISNRRLVRSGRLKVVLIQSSQPEQQMRQVIAELGLDSRFRPFTRCLECNQSLEERLPEEVRERVPPHVYRTQRRYRECPVCRRVYWPGTHWSAMTATLEGFREVTPP